MPSAGAPAPTRLRPGSRGALASVVSRSVLAALPDDVLDRLLVGARPVEAPAGTVLYREGDAPRCGVLLSGLARVSIAGPDGRQVTMRYMRPGALSGSSLAVTGAPAGVRAQAVTAFGMVRQRLVRHLMLPAGPRPPPCRRS